MNIHLPFKLLLKGLIDTFFAVKITLGDTKFTINSLKSLVFFGMLDSLTSTICLDVIRFSHNGSIFLSLVLWGRPIG